MGRRGRKSKYATKADKLRARRQRYQKKRFAQERVDAPEVIHELAVGEAASYQRLNCPGDELSNEINADHDSNTDPLLAFTGPPLSDHIEEATHAPADHDDPQSGVEWRGEPSTPSVSRGT
jgi:hypothetical protein